MSHRSIGTRILVIAVCLFPQILGCGNGALGLDDILPWTCALGPTQPLQLQTPPSRDSAGRIKIYLLRGFLNSYSLGFDQLAAEMRGLNLDPTIVEWPLWEPAAQKIVSEHASMPEGIQYMLVGHSYGSDDAVRMARHLKDNSIQVQLLFLLDATAPDPIPDNVVRCIHYYGPWLPGDVLPDFFSGNPVVAEQDNARTQLSNLPFTQETLGDGIGCANHFSIDVNQLMHNLVIKEVLQLTATP